MAKLFATRDAEISQREKQNMDRARRIAAQSMVLLENNGVLPLRLSDKPLAVFGSGVRRTVKGGTGSGDVNSRSVYNVEQGLQKAGYVLASTAWLDRYDHDFSRDRLRRGFHPRGRGDPCSGRHCAGDHRDGE